MAKLNVEKSEVVESVTIAPLRFGQIVLKLTGTAPFVQNKFSFKALKKIQETQEAGKSSGSRRNRTARNFEDDYANAQYRFPDGSNGIHAGAFRKAAISACRLADFKMTLAKLSIFIEADGYDKDDGTPLVKLHGTPDPWDKCILPVRNQSGVMDLRCRPMWRDWHVNLRVRWDLDQFKTADIVNLFNRAGQQCGVGEGRPNSSDSDGMGWGLFQVEAQS